MSRQKEAIQPKTDLTGDGERKRIEYEIEGWQAPDCEAPTDTDALIDLIERHTRALSEIILVTHTPQELQEEVTELSDLLTSFRYRTELVAKLIDSTTQQEQRNSIRAMLRAMKIQPLEHKEQASALLARSNELIKKAASFITRAQGEISRTAHLFAGYTAKVCGLCKGVETGPDDPCRVCKGKGSVLVHEPTTKCSRCDGHGKTKETDVAVHYSAVCVGCNGTGWERVQAIS